MGYSPYARGKIHDLWFGTGPAPTTPANLYVAMFTGDPQQGGAELAGNGYGRVQVPTGTANWERLDTETVQTKTSVTFAGPSPSPHPTTTYAGIFDAPTGGNLVASGQLTTPRSWSVGVPQVFNAGAIRVIIREAV